MLTHNIVIARRTTYALMFAAAIVQAPSNALAKTITGNETLSADRTAAPLKPLEQAKPPSVPAPMAGLL